MFDVTIDQIQGSFVYQLGGADARWRPFLCAGAGAAIFSSTDITSETKLALNAGAGLKWLPSKRLGARLSARYVPTYLHDASSDFCDPFGFCQDWLHQFELTAGVVVRSYAASGGCSRERSGRVWLSKISSSPSRNGPASPPTGLSIIVSPR